MVKLDLQFAAAFLADREWEYQQPFVTDIVSRLHKGEVPGADFLGWIHLPSETLKQGIELIEQAGARIRENSDAVVVIGIGGSYLGARAAFEWCKPEYYNQLPQDRRGGPEVYFAGNQLSPAAFQDLLQVLQGKRVSLNVISKSGTTTEPAVAFRLLRQWLTDKVGAVEADKRIYVTTDRQQGALKHLADAKGYPTFVIPDDVGGRYSVLTPVGLLPLAAAGVDIRKVLMGAATAEAEFATAQLIDNPALRYAVVRNVLHQKGKAVEILVTYEPALRSFAEWWKQLFGESEGKDQKGLYPASVANTTDLHSMGQFIQEGSRNLFETVVRVENQTAAVSLPSDPQLEDGLEYLAGKSLAWVNDQARLATQMAHRDGGVPNLTITVPDKSEQSLGELFYFFELACATSSQLLGVNGFDQPGVEAYKTNMFALLGKPGVVAQNKGMKDTLH